VVGLTACAGLHPTTGPVIADRPGYTDGPTALPGRSVQVEAGVTDDRVDGVTYQSLGELLVRAGIGGRTELRLFGNSYGFRSVNGGPTTHGVEDFKFGAKVALHALPDSVHGWIPRLAVLAATTLPTGAADRTAHRAQPEAKLAASWTTSGPFSLYSNLGFGAVYDGTAWGSHGWGSVALWFAASSKVSLFGEGLVTGRIGGTASSGDFVNGGLTYLFGTRLQADLRVGHGLGASVAHEHFVGAGVAWRW
jgi:Putative MetA-pathway of phenol degradation